MKKYFLLVIILSLASLLRLPILGDFPNGFSGDEVQQGYSAYSILKTGQDEWGQSFPIFPRGFGDFKPPLYTYLTVPSIAVFGLTIEAVRIPSAIMGILTVLVVFFLAKELFNDKKIAYWSAFIMAILPWHIQLSRTAFEGGTGILFFSMGLLFYLKSLKDNRYLVLSAFSWGLTFYAYHSFRVFTALFIIVLIILSRKKLFNIKNLAACLVLFLFILPLILNLKTTLVRASDVGITSQQSLESYYKNKGTSSLPYLVDRTVDNKVLYVANKFLENYLSYFSPQFFFTGLRSDGSYLNFPYYPLDYPVEIVLWIVAGYFLIFKKQENGKIVTVWFLLSAIPASLAQDGASAHRAVTFLPLVAIISGLGAAKLVQRSKNIQPVLIAIMIISLLTFLRFYFIKLPEHPPESLRMGYEETFKEILKLADSHDEVVISKSFTQPQIFVAFYGQVDPKVFQQASLDWLRYEKANKLYIDQLESWNLGKFLFEGINWQEKDSKRKNALIVGRADEFSANLNAIFEYKDLKDKVVYKIISTQK